MRIETPLGPLTLSTDPRGAVTGLSFAGGDAEEDHRTGRQVEQQLEEYFSGERQQFDLPLAPQGTEFQQRVWALLATPYGSTVTYGQLAEQLGGRGLARAVGLACGRNPVSIIIPCHRVIGGNGELVGYAWGLERKRALLALEKGIAFTSRGPDRDRAA